MGFKKNDPVLGEHWAPTLMFQRAGENPLKESKKFVKVALKI
jgi:hypothetical protein